MSNYYLIRPTSNPNITGLDDGSGQGEIVREKFHNKTYFDQYIEYYEGGDEKTYWQNRLKVPDFDFELEYVRLRKKARLTDFMDFFPNLFSGGRFLLSEKALNLFKHFKLGEHKFINAQVYEGQRKINYYFLCNAALPYAVVDFKRTIFSEDSTSKKNLFHLDSGSDFEMMKELELIDVEKLCFNSNFDRSLDYFIPIISIPCIFISEGLKEAIEAENLTGLNILEPREPTLEFL